MMLSEKLKEIIMPEFEKFNKNFRNSIFKNRKPNVSKSHFDSQWDIYSNCISFIPPEDGPIANFVRRIEIANDISTYMAVQSKKTQEFERKPLRIPKRLKKASDKFEIPFEYHLLPMLPDDLNGKLINDDKTESIIEPDVLRFHLNPYIRLMIWTSLEEYLRMRLRIRMIPDDLSKIDIKELSLEFFPKKKRNKLRIAFEKKNYDETKKIMDECLETSLHNFEDAGKVCDLFSKWYNIDLTKYEKLDEIKLLSKWRHIVVHNGIDFAGLLYMDIKYRDNRKVSTLCMNFVDWIEEQITLSNKKMSKK
jgi:hypothetical protein